MNFEIDNIDYEDMDDLILADRIEWNHAQFDELNTDEMDDVFKY